MKNISKFKMNPEVEEFALAYIRVFKGNNDLYNKDDIIFISGPMTNVENYEEKFKNRYNIIKDTFSERDVFIINPVEILDDISKHIETSYIDRLYITLNLLSLATMIIVDDSNTELLEKSVGTTSELVFALSSNIPIYGDNWLYNAYRFKKYLCDGVDITK